MSVDAVRAHLSQTNNQLAEISSQLLDLVRALELCQDGARVTLQGSTSPAVESITMIGKAKDQVEQAGYMVDAASGSLEDYIATL